MGTINPLTLFDEDGFMRVTDAWNEDTARQIAALDGLGELDARQLSLLRQLRESYRRLGGAPPALAHVCRLEGLAQNCMDTLFPTPREAWRIAGLPNPGEEAKSYL